MEYRQIDGYQIGRQMEVRQIDESQIDGSQIDGQMEVGQIDRRKLGRQMEVRQVGGQIGQIQLHEKITGCQKNRNFLEGMNVYESSGEKIRETPILGDAFQVQNVQCMLIRWMYLTFAIFYPQLSTQHPIFIKMQFRKLAFSQIFSQILRIFMLIQKFLVF